jgi:phage gp46-like protein
MADIEIAWLPELMAGDDLLLPPDLSGANELVSALAISLFTHRTALEDDTIAGRPIDNRRGWWADHEAAEIYPGATPIGSRLWLLSREKQTEETRLRAEDYIRESLAWMIDERLATDIGLNVTWFAHERLGAEITIYRGSQKSIAVRFEKLWDGIER